MTKTPDPPADPFEANRDRQLEMWAALPASRRVAWLEEAVAAAYASGALPARRGTPSGGNRADYLPPLEGAFEDVRPAERARSAALDRLAAFCRGPLPPGADPIRFAEIGTRAQLALWRVSDAAFWIAHETAETDELIAEAAIRDARLGVLLRGDEAR